MMPAPKRKVIARVQPPSLTRSPGESPPVIKTTAFQCVSFFDQSQNRQVVILYSLGADGIIREFTGGNWLPYPVST